MRAAVAACVFALALFIAETECQADEWSANWLLPSTAVALAPPPQNGVLLFAGQFTTVPIGKSLLPTAPHESNYIAGGAYERDFFQRWGFALGTEIGVAQRFGMGKSTEVWAGLNVRYTAFVFLNTVRIIPGITAGFSYITRPVGHEAEEEAAVGGDARLLGYLGPELAFSLVNFPNVELVYKLQHRSGAGGTFGKMHDTANANVVGLRVRF